VLDLGIPKKGLIDACCLVVKTSGSAVSPTDSIAGGRKDYAGMVFEDVDQPTLRVFVVHDKQQVIVFQQQVGITPPLEVFVGRRAGF